jgi:hypothetical protein
VSFQEAERTRNGVLQPDPSTFGQWKAKFPKPFHCLCKLFEFNAHSSELWRLNLIPSPEATRIENHKGTPRLYQPESLADPVTLEALLRTRGKRWTGTGQFALGLILAYSLFYLYGGQWAKGRWGRKNIIFYEHDRRIYPKPFLSSGSSGTHDPPTRVDDCMHKFPEILELGIILLEIHIDQDLSSYLGREPGTEVETSDGMLLRASEVFEAEKQRMASPLYRDAIEWCLEVYHDFDRDDEDVAFEGLRTALFEQVISPLECEIRRTFGRWISVDRLDEDEEAEKINLAPNAASRGISLRRYHDKTADDGHASKRHRPCGPQSRPMPSLLTESRSNAKLWEGTAAFGITRVATADKSAHETKIPRAKSNTRRADCFIGSTPSGTFWDRYVHIRPTTPKYTYLCTRRPGMQCSRNWLENLDRVTGMMKVRKTLELIDDSYRPVKIAVLDTGLESDLRFGDVTYRDFVDPDRLGRVDNTSHGTASVDLILQAYPEAELYVGRVFNTNQTDERLEPAQLAEVGEQARSIATHVVLTDLGHRLGGPRRCRHH